MNRGKTLLSLALIGIFSHSCRDRPQRVSGSKPSFVEAHGFLTVQNAKIVDKNQQPIQLRGMSLFWSQWGGAFWNKDVVSTLKSEWQATVIRAPMGVEVGGYLTNPALEKDRVKLIVEEAIAEGIYVIIDWHDHSAHLHPEKAVEFFSEMAALYGKYPHVIFEIYNEPTDVSWDLVKAYADTVIPVIRAQGARNLVVVGTPHWSQRVDWAAAKPIDDDNVAYALHFYAASHKQELRDIAASAISQGLPLFVTEFGVCDVSGTIPGDLEETELWLDFLAQHGISWVNWALFDKQDNASALKAGTSVGGDWTESDLTTSGAYIKNKLGS